MKRVCPIMAPKIKGVPPPSSLNPLFVSFPPPGVDIDGWSIRPKKNAFKNFWENFIKKRSSPFLCTIYRETNL